MIPTIRQLYPRLEVIPAILQALTDGIITLEEAGECYETYVRFVHNINLVIRSIG